MRLSRIAYCLLSLICGVGLSQPNRFPSANHRTSQPAFGSFVELLGPTTSRPEPAPRLPLTKEPTTFETPLLFGSGGYDLTSIAVGDVNGDSKPDLVVSNLCQNYSCPSNAAGEVGVLLGNGDGTFQPVVIYNSGGQYAVSIALADVNGDGKLDLIVANEYASCGTCTNSGISILLGNGDGTFQQPVVYGAGNSPLQVVVADINADGNLDLIVANISAIGFSNTDSWVAVLLGNGDGTFQSAQFYDSGGFEAESVAAEDLNGDGKIDLAVTNDCGANSGSGYCEIGQKPVVAILLGNGDGTFQMAVPYDTGGGEGNGVSQVVIADVNSDGKPDLLIGNPEGAYSDSFVGVLLGNGDGTFQKPTDYDSGVVGIISLAVGDVNEDGLLDVAVDNGCYIFPCPSGDVGILVGNGDGTFQTSGTYGTEGYTENASPGSLTIVDVNGDGRPDLLVANACGSTVECGNGSTGTVAVLININSTTTTLVSSVNPSNFGQNVTFTATVIPQGQGTPTGMVDFLDGTQSLGYSALNGSAVATFSTATLAMGTHSISAVYSGDKNFAPSTSPVLYQVVLEAIAVLSPSNINFGNQTLNIASSPQVSILTNIGNGNLTISSISSNNSEFPETNNCPASIPPNGSCQISVTFTPTNTGTQTAAVSVVDNAPGSPQQLSLTGTGVVPELTFSPTSLTFPTQVVFTTSPPQKVTLTNTGLGILKIIGGGLTGKFGETNNCKPTIAPGASCTINVTFKPTAKGVVNGDISVTDNAPDSPQKLPLTGVGTYVLLSPISVNFGTQPVNTTSQPKYISFTNKGSGTVNFTGAGISITGTDAGDFVETNNCGSSVASGASCKIKVTFTPSAQGTRTASVSISDDGGGSPQTVPLTGIGTP